MIERFFGDPTTGRLRLGRLLPVLGLSVVMALFGTLLVFATPMWDHPAMQLTWVLFAVAGLKLPLVVMLWGLILRNREWPGRRARWSPEETHEILGYLEREARRAMERPDAPARLAYLSRESWHVADQVDGDQKVDALTVALRVDEMAGHVGERPPRG